MRDGTPPPQAVLTRGTTHSPVAHATLGVTDTKLPPVRHPPTDTLSELVPLEPVDSPVRVLHVEDDPEFASLTRSFLEENERLTVITEVDPRQAIDRIRREAGDIDCVVSDYRMPKMDGIELFHAVRKDNPTMPFILFTTELEERLKAEAVPDSVTEIIPKGGRDQHQRLIDRVLAVTEGDDR